MPIRHPNLILKSPVNPRLCLSFPDWLVLLSTILDSSGLRPRAFLNSGFGEFRHLARSQTAPTAGKQIVTCCEFPRLQNVTHSSQKRGLRVMHTEDHSYDYERSTCT